MGPDEIMRKLGNTRRVALSALYADILRRSHSSPTETEALVRATEPSSVRRLDMVKMIIQLLQVCRTSPFVDIFLIQTQVGGQGRHRENQLPPAVPGAADDDSAVLCKKTLAEIWSDMKRTVLPSRISPVPRAVGSPSSGKLTADQWRTFCTIHLVISLVRLWGREQLDTRKSHILVNFLHLVSLTNLIHMRTMTPEHIENIERENLAYLQGLRVLYPDFSLVPKHHMSLHFPGMLRDFGPVHGWRTFAFERLNQIFQNILTNSISGRYFVQVVPTTPLTSTAGQLEHTILNRFCMAQSLHGLIPLLDNSSQLIQAFNRRFKLGGAGTFRSDILAISETAGRPVHDNLTPRELDRETASLLRAWKHVQPGYSKLGDPRWASYLKKYEHRGAELKPKRVSFGDSLVVVGNRERWRGAQIESLFDVTLHTSGVEKHHTLAKVVYFPELSGEDALHDQYRRFQNSGRIFYSQDETSEKAVLSVEEIMSHCAITSGVCDAISKKHIHALPLIQVSLAYSHIQRRLQVVH